MELVSARKRGEAAVGIGKEQGKTGEKLEMEKRRSGRLIFK